MFKTAVVVGTQWGDEGKGKITDYLANKANVVVRYQGGNNAGHTIVFNEHKYALHLLPSGIFDSKIVNVMANGMVINLKALEEELDYISNEGFNDFQLKISNRAHVVMPYHIDLDKYYETIKDDKVGTTHKGIGPAYTDKASRIGIRIIDLYDYEELCKKIEFNLLVKKPYLDELAVSYDVLTLATELFEYGQMIKQYVCDTSLYLNECIKADKKVLFEGAQGIMLCLDHGTYPFVTSSSPTASSIPLNTGIRLQYINNVVGIAKAYSTRVGMGAFPSEFEDEIAKTIREAGNEYGTTTGRPRRIGWFDSVVVRHAVRVGSINYLSIMLLDVLSGIDKLQVCTHYLLNGEKIDYIPASIKDFEQCKPVCIEVAGWQEDITNVTSFDELPDNAKKYIKLLEELCEVEVAMFSVGPDRKQTIELKEDIL